VTKVAAIGERDRRSDSRVVARVLAINEYRRPLCKAGQADGVLATEVGSARAVLARPSRPAFYDLFQRGNAERRVVSA
jgi:hypothetical protein